MKTVIKEQDLSMSCVPSDGVKKPDTQLNDKVYNGSINSLVGLESKRSYKRIYFSDRDPGRIAGNILWGFAAVIIIMIAVLSFTNVQDGRIFVQLSLLALGFILIGVILRQFHARYLIIDFKENICAFAWKMTERSLTEKLYKHDDMRRIKKDDVYGVTVNYMLVGTREMFSRQGSLRRQSNLDLRKTLSEIVTACAPVLLRKNGEIIPLKEYETGAEYATKANATAKIVSKLWNLPYYECPKDSQVIPIILPKSEPECSFKQLTIHDFTKSDETFTQSTFSWIFLAIFILVILPVTFYFYMK